MKNFQVKTKGSFILHLDSLDILDEMTNEQAGIFFKAIKFYRINGKLPDLDFGLKMAIAPFLNQFQRDDEKWHRVAERNKINGSRGGRPKNPTEPRKPSGLFGNPTEPRKPVNVNVNVSGNVNDNVILNKKKDEIIVPDFVDVELWNGFLEMRKKQKSPLTELAIKLIIGKLETFETKKIGNANEALRNSLQNSWKGVFEPKADFKSSKQEETNEHEKKRQALREYMQNQEQK